MSVFDIFRKKKKKKKRPTVDQEIRKLELKQKRVIYKIWLDMIQKDPNVARQTVAKAFDIKLPDQNEATLMQLEALIGEFAIKRVQTDPEIRGDAEIRKILQMLQPEGLAPTDEEIRNRPTQMEQLINMADEVNKFKAALGIKAPGFLEKYLTPELLEAVLPIITGILGQKTNVDNTEQMVMVEINGEQKEITMSEYKMLKREKQQTQNGDSGASEAEVQKKNGESEKESTAENAGENDGNHQSQD